MSISSIGNGSGISTSQTRQLDYQNKLDNNQPSTQKTTAEKVGEKGTANINRVSASSVSIEKSLAYDLENISPKETYQLASDLLKSETIGLYDYAQLMIIGANQEYPPAQANNKNPNNAPYNLLKELDSIVSASHEHFKFASPSDRKETKSLLDLLTSLSDKTEKSRYTSIDITV